MNNISDSGRRTYVKWGQDETRLLFQCVKRHGQNWKLISQKIAEGKFSESQCRWKYVRCRKIMEGKQLGFWSKELNERLQQAAENYPGDWETIGTLLDIDPKRCQAHYAVLNGNFEPKLKRARQTVDAVSEIASDSFSEAAPSPKPPALPVLVEVPFEISLEVPLLPPPPMELRYSFSQGSEPALSPPNLRVSDSWIKVLN